MEELNKIQTELSVPKAQFNSFGKYNYRDTEDILGAVKPLLKETKCTLLLSDSLVELGNRIYVKSIATLENSKGDKRSAEALAREAETKAGMDVAQITGSASSYARKAALNGLFAIDDNKDPDETNQSVTTATTIITSGAPSSSNGTSAHVANDAKKWLNPGTPEFDAEARKLATGGTMGEIETRWKIGKNAKNDLIAAAAKLTTK